MAERDDEGFLARWSRRKQAARQAELEPEAEPGAPQAQPGVPPAPTGAAGANALEPPPEADRPPALPDPATLDASSDFSVFLGRDVPIETHRAALRRLWRLDPIYNRMDGLDDYCEDYTDQAKVVKGLRTAYKVGRGMLEQLGDAKAPPQEAPTTQRPSDEAPRVAAAPDDPTPLPPDSSAQQSDPFAQQRDREKPTRATEKRGPRPLPKRS